MVTRLTFYMTRLLVSTEKITLGAAFGEGEGVLRTYRVLGCLERVALCYGSACSIAMTGYGHPWPVTTLQQL